MIDAAPQFPRERPYRVEVSVDTMVERLAQVHTPLSPQSRDKLVAIHRPASAEGRKECTDLVGCRPAEAGGAARDTELVHFFEDPDSPSGWSHAEFPIPEVVPNQAVRALTGFHQNGVTYLFVQYRSQTEAFEGADLVQLLYATWQGGRPVWREKRWSGGTTANLLNGVRQLSVHRRPDGTHVVYGVSRGYGREREQFFMLLPKVPERGRPARAADVDFTAVRDSGRQAPGWTDGGAGHVYQIAEPLDGPGLEPDSAATTRFELLRLTHGCVEFHRAVVEPTGAPGRYRFRFERDRDVRLEQPGLDLTDARLLSVPLGQEEVLMLRTSDGRLGLLAGLGTGRAAFESLMSDAGPERIGRLALGTVGRIGAADSELALFVTDAEDRLWVRRLGREARSHWVPLGDKVEELACPRSTSSHGEVFLVAPAARVVSHKVRNGETSTWMTQTLAVSTRDTSKVVPISAHVFEIHVADARGIALPDHPVTVTTAAPANLYIDGVCYRTGPRLPLVLKTDPASGRIRAVMRAAGLAAPLIRVRIADAEGPGCDFHPNARITTRLAGNARGYTVAKTIGSLVPEGSRRNVEQALKHYGEAASKAARGVKSDGSLRSGYRLSVHQGGAFEDVSKDAAVLELMTSPAADASGPFSFGDIVNYLGHALHQVEEVLVGVLDAGVTLVVKIAGETFRFLSTAFESVVDSLDAFAHMLEAVFRAMGRAIVGLAKKILEAVSFLLNGEHVFAANDAAQAAVKGLFRLFAHSAETGADKIDKAFREHVAKIDSALDRMSGAAGDGQALAGRAGTEPFEMNGVKVEAPALVARKNSAGANLMGTALSHYARTVPDPSPAGAVPSGTVKALLDKVKAFCDGDLTQCLKEVRKAIEDKDWFETLKTNPFLVLTLLRKTIKAVVDLTGDLLVLAIRLVRELIETFLKSLETPIDIPVLTTLVRLWSGDADRRLTYFDILTLPGAFLGTAIWKIVSGGRILVSKEQARIFIEWVDKPNGPIDLWAVLERFQPAASGALSDQAPVGAAKGDFPKDPGIVILVLKSLRMAGSFTTLVVLGPLSMANKTMQIWQVDGLFGKVLGALVFVASAVVLVIGVGGMLVQWILEMAAQKHFPSGKAMPKGSPAFNGRGVAIQVVAVVAVLLLMALLMADVLMAALGSLFFPVVAAVMVVVGAMMLLYFTIAIVVEALDLGTNPDNVWSIVLYAFRFAGIVALMGADLMAILAYFSKAEPTTGAILTTISLTLMRLGDVLNETPIIISEAIILGQM